MTPGPRPRQRLSEAERRDQLMEATVEVIAARGYQGASSEAIAQHAGLSKGLLWHYFDDLDQLMEDTARRTLMSLAKTVGANIDLTAPVDDVIRSAIHAAADLRRTHGAQRTALREIVINLRRADGSQRLGQADYEDLYAAQERIFRRGQEEGVFRETLDPRLLAVTYQGAVDGMIGYLDAHPDTDASKHADTVADILLAGMCRRITGEQMPLMSALRQPSA